ncbi:hypothetical protein [Microseira sp. BLCC-F43]|jgi:hypothetical protein|uniref:hypothetical protein n=1 Tax=Microseira sp. BLCC-F43 TaxID=3153602 RepID=UPI0035B843AF
MTKSCNSDLRSLLFSWIIIRQLPNLQRITVGKFRNRSDAEGHLQILRRMIPHARFEVVFDLPVRQYPGKNT